MEILATSQRARLIERMTQLRFQLPEWMIVEIKIKSSATSSLSSASVASILHDLFKDYDGLAMPCSSSDALMLIHWGKDNDPHNLAVAVRSRLTDEVCEAKVAPMTPDGIKKISLLIAPHDDANGQLHAARAVRQANIFMVADDDMYMRSLVKAGLKDLGHVIEVGNGNDVIAAYQDHNPDMLLLDIHLPGMDGPSILTQLNAIDPKAYVVMLSADSSPENVLWANKQGARGFLAKPLSKPKLLEYAKGCPTVERPE